MPARCWRTSAALLFLLLALAARPAVAPWGWPRGTSKPDISSAAACRRASAGVVWRGESINQQLTAFLKVNGPVLSLPTNYTDVTTAATILQLAAPGLKVVLDPLLYLKLLPKAPGFPKLIHMTMRDKHSLAPHQILSMLSWGRFNPGHTLLLYDNDDIAAFMAATAPGFMPTFNALTTHVEKSDAWRYAVLCAHGGIYADTDTVCAKPFEAWADLKSEPSPGLVVGIENRFHSQAEAEEASYVHQIQMVQWVIASKRSHPVVCRMGHAIKRFVDDEAEQGGALEAEMGHDASILLRTGPGIWSSEVHSYLRQMGSSPEAVVEGGRAADLLVLPQAAFGCNFRYWNTDNNETAVYHAFNNSWKVDHYNVADAKRAKREAAARAARLAKLRLLWPLLIVLSAACGVLLAVYAGLCLASGQRVLAWKLPHLAWLQPASRRGGGSSCSSRKRRPLALASSSSPRGSPRQRAGGGGSSGVSQLLTGRDKLV